MNTKILVCISGGIDSSLSTLLLKEQGYDIVAATFRVYDGGQPYTSYNMKRYTDSETITEAKHFAQQIGIEHYILDYREYFANTIIDYFVKEYMQGRTPNPCVNCNYEIKWGKVLEFAESIGCDYIATGHYARVYKKNNRFVLAKGIDTTKDQSYFLWKLNQEQLSKTLFPLGDLTKQQVRKMAADRGFVKLSKKNESQEICFVPNNDYRSFLQSYVSDINKFQKKGNVITTDGKIVGQHNGIAFYTIGQRKGLGIALGQPYYIFDIKKQTNEIVIGKYNELEKKSFIVENLNMIALEHFVDGMEVYVKIRYRTKEFKAKVYNLSKNSVKVVPFDKVYAVTPGQSAVFYLHDEVLAGGIIQ